MRPAVILLALALALACVGALPGAAARRLTGKERTYEVGDPVPLLANKIGPFSNPSETYRYYDLPFCQPEKLEKQKGGLGDAMDANRMTNTPYEIKFREDVDSATLCTAKLDKKAVGKLLKAVEAEYYFNMYFDDLPLWGFIGKTEQDTHASTADYKRLLHTHLPLEVAYNEDRVIEVHVAHDASEADDVVDITDGEPREVTFTYSVAWKPTTIPYAQRMDKYARYSFLPQHMEIHWFSIVNSCVTVLLLTGFLATILLRVLRKDVIKYQGDEEALDDAEETGWKYVHADVFRFPRRRGLFCALVGTGYQLLLLSVLLFALALAGQFYPHNRGAIMVALVLLYAFTAWVSGYASGMYFRQMGGGNWVRNTLVTCAVLAGPFFATFCWNNTVAIAYRSTAALPLSTIALLFFIWGAVTVPLTIAGAIVGKNSRSTFAAPVRTNKYPRETPDLTWFRSTPAQMVMAGFLPFSAIYIELYYIFASVWGHKVYTIYSILAVVYCILVLVTAFITVALTYFQLAAEDHRWWWRSFLCGGSTGVFVYAYCFYYYFFRADMSGMLQTSFYFGYMACICYAFFLMLGTVGWRASLAFVRYIYGSVKCE
ncbi:unnamed protein product [Pedinophyceae sp. YPF-701]|nr:unnamed protein product [Pedinophyceae sp. YPF-701]